MTSRLIEGLGTTEALAGAFSDEAVLGAMLAFEVDLARIEARLGLIPTPAARAIADAAAIDAFDAATIAAAARTSGTIVVPFVERLRARVQDIDAAAATFVHWGATSQDVADTALVVCLSRARTLLEADHERLARQLAHLSEQHAGTVMLARTLLQPAPPITFGLKAAGWLAAIARGWVGLSAAFEEALVLQFGGASGTLAALGDQGPAVAAALARELGLRDPGAPWHTDRSRLATLVTACGVLTGSLGKLARDLSLLMQAEVAEASESGGTSSTMPHKRNPAACAIVLAQATRVPPLVSAYLAGMPQEHERGVGGWHAEAVSVATVVQATGAALAGVARIVEELQVDPARMRNNLDATRGVVFAERAMMRLAPVLGRESAARVVADALGKAARDRCSFGVALASCPDLQQILEAAEVNTFDDPRAYLGAAETFRRRLLGGD